MMYSALSYAFFHQICADTHIILIHDIKNAAIILPYILFHNTLLVLSQFPLLLDSTVKDPSSSKITDFLYDK